MQINSASAFAEWLEVMLGGLSQKESRDLRYRIFPELRQISDARNPGERENLIRQFERRLLAGFRRGVSL